MSFEMRPVDFAPKPDVLPDETTESWLGNILHEFHLKDDVTLNELGIHDAHHPAIYDLAYMFNREVKNRLSVIEIWKYIGGIRKKIRNVRETISSLKNDELLKNRMMDE